MPLVAVTTETLLGVAIPVMVGAVEPPPDPLPDPLLDPPELEVDDVPPESPELVEAVSPEPEPPQPAIKPATAAAQAKPRSCLRH